MENPKMNNLIIIYKLILSAVWVCWRLFNTLHICSCPLYEWVPIPHMNECESVREWMVYQVLHVAVSSFSSC